MITIKNCDVAMFDNGKIAHVTLPDNPDYETMMYLGRGKPCHGYYLLSLEYVRNGISYYLMRSE